MCRLGKQVWKLLSNHHGLSTQVLKAKYLKKELVILASTKQNYFYLQMGILKIVNTVKEGFSFWLGKGNLFLWYDY